MEDTFEHGRRPFRVADAQPSDGSALAICPGKGLDAPLPEEGMRGELTGVLLRDWGPVYGVWEGWAADSGIRYAGSSGGAASALALFCLERAGMEGVLHTAAREDIPYLNETVYSRSREELAARTGSRYAPASPVEGLTSLEAQPGPSVFIGKPCDAAAVKKAAELRPGLAQKLGVTIAFFCAGTPSVAGNLALLKRVGVDDPAKVRRLRYRGNGWPGLWTVEFVDADGNLQTRELTYADSWGFLQRYRQWRCYICPDHTGEHADIAVGDPWYRPVEPGEAGKSLIVARSKRGLDLILEAEKAGYLVLETKDETLLARSQPNLLQTRGSLWGRLLTLRLLGAGAPRFRGYVFLPLWLGKLTLLQKAQSVYGTAKRVFRKGLRTRAKPQPWTPCQGQDSRR